LRRRKASGDYPSSGQGNHAGVAKAGPVGWAAFVFFNCYELITIGSTRLVDWPTIS
jgi:hypothetical protein